MLVAEKWMPNVLVSSLDFDFEMADKNGLCCLWRLIICSNVAENVVPLVKSDRILGDISLISHKIWPHAAADNGFGPIP